MDVDEVDDYIDALDYDDLDVYLDSVDQVFGENMTDSIINELIDNFDDAHGIISEGDPFVDIQF